MKIYSLEVFFQFAHFKIPYTVKTRKSYLIPRKKTIFSFFNAFLKKPISFWQVKQNKKIVKNGDKLIDNELLLIKKHYNLREEEKIFVGAELLEANKLIEVQRVVQYKGQSKSSLEIERPAIDAEILNNVRYVFYLVDTSEKLEIDDKVTNYYIFGGWNDYLSFNWKLTKNISGQIVRKKYIYTDTFQLFYIREINITDSTEMIIEHDCSFDNYIVGKGKIFFKNEREVLILGNENNSKEIVIYSLFD